jgi:WhiB family redox-sensing transcriptional regulator
MTSVVMCDAEPAQRRHPVELAQPHPCCADPDLFFPISEEGPSLRQIAAAKAVCASCAQLPACLRQALDGNEEGIWGGTTKLERDAMRRYGQAVSRLGRSA